MFVELQGKMSASQRLEGAFTYSDFVRRMQEGGIRAQYPGASEREVFLRAARRRLGDELFQKVYGAERLI